ncbi:MAG: hypothetical protein KUG78_19940 [Kangiellaceae bacterium]|nr:hypothetical protein [Kangiellaceae bacterium]
MKKLVLLSALLIPSIQADTLFEVTAGAGQYSLDVDSKRGTQLEDDSTATNFSIGAYRSTTANSSWGAVLEVSSAISREDDLPGSGRMIGFRFADYLSQINDSSSYELYAGFAQFDWLKKANGYYFGANYRYNLFGEHSGLMIDGKYYQDLAYDSPTGDDIVDGFQTSVKFYYRF